MKNIMMDWRQVDDSLHMLFGVWRVCCYPGDLRIPPALFPLEFLHDPSFT